MSTHPIIRNYQFKKSYGKRMEHPKVYQGAVLESVVVAEYLSVMWGQKVDFAQGSVVLLICPDQVIYTSLVSLEEVP